MRFIRLAAGATILVITDVSVCLAQKDVTTSADLMVVLALQGLPCSQVTQVKQLGEQDFLVQCKDSNRYHVYVDATGRVVAGRQ